MKKTIIAIIVVVVIGLIIYFISRGSAPAPVEETPTNTETVVTPATSTAVVQTDKTKTVIGTSVEDRDITAYHFGTGTKEILFIGGIHGGYEWNSALVAFTLVDYLKANPTTVPDGLKVTVIPLLNPDGFYKVIGTTTGQFDVNKVTKDTTKLASGRFNGNTVDLNRNFDCDWQETGTWNKTPVSGGDSAFSEPESQAVKSYVESSKPTAVIVWYSSAGGVYASNCHGGVSDETNTLLKTFATASGYPAHATFDFYETTGDLTNWLSKIGTPAVSVLLTNHTGIEWTKNLAGVQAVLKYYAQ